MSSRSARALAAGFLLDFGVSLSYVYLTLEIYGRFGLQAYFASLSLSALANLISTLTLSFLNDLLRSLKLPSIMLISLPSLLAAYLALHSSNLIPLSFLLGLIMSYEPFVIAQLTEEMGHGEASGVFYTVSRIGITLGVLTGGVLFELFGIQGTLLISSMLTLSSLPFLPSGGTSVSKDSGGKNYGMMGLCFLISILILETMLSLSYSLMEVKLYDSLGRSTSLVGFLYSVSTIIDALLSPALGKLIDVIGGLRSFIVAAFIQLVLLFSCTASHSPLVLTALLMLPAAPIYFSAKNRLSADLFGENNFSSLSLPASVSSLSDLVFYGILSVSLRLF